MGQGRGRIRVRARALTSLGVRTAIPRLEDRPLPALDVARLGAVQRAECGELVHERARRLGVARSDGLAEMRGRDEGPGWGWGGARGKSG